MNMKAVITVVCLVSLSGCSSGNHVVQTEEEAQIFLQTMKEYGEKNKTPSMSKEEGCRLIEKSIAVGFDAIDSSFSAMNNWVEDYKDPKMALLSNTVPSQVYIAMAMALEKCEPILEDNEAKKMVSTFVTVNDAH